MLRWGSPMILSKVGGLGSPRNRSMTSWTCLDPPERAVVFSVDENSQVQV